MIIPNFYPYYPNAGGAERQCLKLSQELIRIGIKIEVLTYRIKKEWMKQEKVFGIPVKRLQKISSNELNLIIWLYHLWKKRNNYDILHIHLFNGTHFIAASWIGRLCNKPVIVKIANSGEEFDIKYTDKLRWPLRKWVFNSLLKSNRIIAISESIKKELIESGIPSKKIVSIPNGVEEIGKAPEYLRIIERKNHLLPKETSVVLTVGSLTPKKGLPYLFKAWRQIKGNWPDALLVVVGGYQLPDYCIEIERDPHSQVRFFLNQPDGVLSFYQSADIFILPSLAEGLSNALLEAQACGLPCIATRVGGNPDIIEDGENGLLIEPKSVDAISDALNVLLGSEELRYRFGVNSLRKVKMFAIESVAEKYSRLYTDLIHEGK